MKKTTEAILLEMKEQFKLKDVNLDVNLSELGLDSLDVAEYLLDLEDRYNVTFESAEMQQLTTLKSLADLIDSKVN